MAAVRRSASAAAAAAPAEAANIRRRHRAMAGQARSPPAPGLEGVVNYLLTEAHESPRTADHPPARTGPRLGRAAALVPRRPGRRAVRSRAGLDRRRQALRHRLARRPRLLRHPDRLANRSPLFRHPRLGWDPELT